jgi:hypothetical protein
VPDFDLADRTRPSERLRAGKGLWLDFDARAPLRPLAHRWGSRIDYVAGNARDRMDLTALLVRPDGVVAWVGERDPQHEGAFEAAARWFGDPDAS